MEAYIAALERALRGPARLKADLMAEARDSLIDAYEAYRQAGLDEQEARRRAIAEFGDVETVRAAYQQELTLAQGRRTAVLMGVAMPAQLLMWDAAWWLLPEERLTTLPPSAAMVESSIDVVAILASAIGAITLLLTGPGSRMLPVPVSLTRWVGRFGLAVLAATAVFCMTLMGLEGEAGPAGWPLIAVLSGVSTVVSGGVLVSVWRCLRAPVPDASATDSGRVEIAG